MNLKKVNLSLERILKIFVVLIPVSFGGFMIYNNYLNPKDYKEARKLCKEEKAQEFNGIIDSVLKNNSGGTVFIKLTDGYSYTIPHSHKYGLRVEKKDSIVKKAGSNIYYIYYNYKSLGIDTADFDCNCSNDKCLDSYY